MSGVYFIFDYFKEAFHINKAHKDLYKPQLVLVIIKLFMLIIIGTGLYIWLGGSQLHNFYYGAQSFSDILQLAITFGSSIVVVLIVYGILSQIIEAGLYNMYKKSVILGETKSGDFWEGVNKYFLWFILGEILLALLWIPVYMTALIAGILTLSLGFAITILVVRIFLSMWKVSLVVNDSGLLAALKDSFLFAKNHFMPLTVLQMIRWAFIEGTNRTGSSGNGGGNNKLQWNESIEDIPSILENDLLPNKEVVFEQAIKFARIAVGIIFIVVTIAVAIAAVIRIIFDIFFSLALFVAYKRQFENPEPLIEGEGSCDVV